MQNSKEIFQQELIYNLGNISSETLPGLIAVVLVSEVLKETEVWKHKETKTDSRLIAHNRNYISSF